MVKNQKPQMGVTNIRIDIYTV